MKIPREEISRVLYNELWSRCNDDKTALNFRTFKEVLQGSGLVSTISTIKSKWLAIGGLCSYTYIPDRNVYLVDLVDLRLDLGVRQPAAGDYILDKEADQ